MQPNPPLIPKLKSLHGVSRGQLPHGSIPLWLVPHIMTLKSLPNLYALPGPTNMTTMIRQHTKFPLLLVLSGKPDHEAIHCPTANVGRLSSGSVTNPMLITVFDAYLTPKVTGSCESGP